MIVRICLISICYLLLFIQLAHAQNTPDLIAKADSLFEHGSMQSAQKHYVQVLQTMGASETNGDTLFTHALTQLGLTFLNMNAPHRADSCFKIVQKRVEHESGKQSLRYATLFPHLYNSNLGKGGEHFADSAYLYLSRLLDSTDTRMIDAEQLLAFNLFRKGQAQQALIQLEVCLAKARKYHGQNHAFLAHFCLDVGIFHQELGDMIKAEPLLKEGMGYFEAQPPKDASDLFSAYRNLAQFYLSKNDFVQTDYYLTKGTALVLQNEGRASGNNLVMTYMRAFYYNQLGQYEKTIALMEDHRPEFKTVFEPDDRRFAAIYGHWGNACLQLKQWDKAGELLQKALNVARKNKSFRYQAQNLAFLGIWAFKTGDFEKSRAFFSESESIYQKANKNNSAMIAESFLWRSLLENATGNEDLALNYAMRSIKNAEMAGWRESLMRLKALNCLANIYGQQGKIDSVEVLYEEVYASFLQGTKRFFAGLPESERLSYLEAHTGFLYQLMESSYKYPSEKLNELALNARIELNGLSLAAMMQQRQTFKNNQDPAYQNQYQAWAKIRQKLASLYMFPASQTAIYKDTISVLEASALEMERDLRKRSAEFDILKPEISIDWKSIQQTLGSGEAAVEVVRYFKSNRFLERTDTVSYCFFVIRPNIPTPQRIDLAAAEMEQVWFELYTLDMSDQSPSWQYSDMTWKAFWQPIEPLLQGVKHVYISNDGIYHRINLQTLFRPDGKPVGSDMNISIVHNLRQIIDLKKKKTSYNTQKTAVLVGNPRFDLPVSIASTSKGRNEKNADNGIRSLSTDPLPYTQKEIEASNEQLKQYGWNTKVLTGADATEANLKQCVHPDVLHVATHGYFLDNIAEMNVGKVSSGAVLRDPLLRSLLLFAGAKQALDGDVSSSSHNEGLLTAYEVVHLDLDNTDLVILSACRTADGTVMNSEGVYGMQSAFYVAGAQSILMSLWNVDDKATQELIASFYKYWLGGMSKQQALQQAQTDLSRHYPQPFYWGAFILAQ